MVVLLKERAAAAAQLKAKPGVWYIERGTFKDLEVREKMGREKLRRFIYATTGAFVVMFISAMLLRSLRFVLNTTWSPFFVGIIGFLGGLTWASIYKRL